MKEDVGGSISYFNPVNSVLIGSVGVPDIQLQKSLHE